MEQKYELYHHGILGMKWGVRRFQNEDGTYTRRGLERYRKSKEEYDRLKYEGASKSNIRSAKKKLSKDYDQLKRDYKADKGKRLHSEGKTIRGNKLNALLSTSAASLVTVAAYRGAQELAKDYLEENNMKGFAIANLVGYASLGIGALAQAGFIAKTASDNSKLRAYYSYSSPKDTRSTFDVKKENNK